MFRFGRFHHKHPVLCISFTWWLSEVSFVILKPNVCYFSSQPLQPLQLQALDFLYPVLNHLLHMKKVRIINKVINIILDLIFIPKKKCVWTGPIFKSCLLPMILSVEADLCCWTSNSILSWVSSEWSLPCKTASACAVTSASIVANPRKILLKCWWKYYFLCDILNYRGKMQLNNI